MQDLFVASEILGREPDYIASAEVKALSGLFVDRFTTRQESRHGFKFFLDIIVIQFLHSKTQSDADSFSDRSPRHHVYRQ